jgi:hypothetical protein
VQVHGGRSHGADATSGAPGRPAGDPDDPRHRTDPHGPTESDGRPDGNRMPRYVAIALVLAVGVVSAVSVAAGRGPASHDPEVNGSMVDGSPLTVSALEVSPGDTLQVAGHGCTLDAGVGVPTVHVWFSPAPGTVEWDPTFGEPVASVTPGADGSWLVAFAVPAPTAPYRLEAACLDDAQPPEGFVYARTLVTVN